jgi:hypothetical protein
MSEIIWEDKYRAETQATKELEREVERLSKRQKEDEEAFWEERDARVELQAQVERLKLLLEVAEDAVHGLMPRNLYHVRRARALKEWNAKADGENK